MARAPLRRIQWGNLLRRLEAFYSTGEWSVPVLRERGVDPYLVLVSTVLSHRTRDPVTERATRRLLSAFPTPTALASATQEQVASKIRDVGLADSKARGLRRAAQQIVERHQGIVPRTERDLIELPLVGKKTASAVLVFGFGQAAIPVDTHIHRVVNRLGVVRTVTRDETVGALRAVVPRKYWGSLNPALVQHGQNICTALAPRCGSCPVATLCNRVGV